MNVRSVRARSGAVAAATCAALLAAPLFSPVSSLAGQELPSFAGVEVRVGVNSPVPDNAGSGLTTSVDLDLGYLANPFIRSLIGFSYFRGSVTVLEGEVPRGDFNAAGGRAGLRADLFEVGDVRPYLSAGVTAHNVSAEVAHPPTQALLEGFYVGVVFAAGAHVALGDQQQFGVTGDLRRLFANNIGHWGFELGLRWTPLGERTYEQPEERIERERERAFEERRRVLEEAREERRARERPPEAREREPEAREREPEAREREPEAREREPLPAAARELRWNLLDLERDLRIVTGVGETDRGLVLTLGRDLFRVDEHTPHRLAREELAQLAEELARHPDLRMSVQAYAGEREADRRLAQRRAEAIRAALVMEGVDPDRVSVEREPRETADRERVEIVITEGAGRR